MEKNKKNISIFKRIGLIAIALCCAIGSLFVSIQKSGHTNFASADSVDISYSFTGSNLFMFDAFMTSSSPSGWYVCSARNSFYKNYNNSHVYAHTDFYWQNSANSFDTSYKMFYLNDNNTYVQGDVPLLPDSHRFVYFSNDEFSANSQGGFPCDVILTGSFNGNVYCVTLGTRSYFSNLNLNIPQSVCFFMTYFDDANNSISFEFVMPSNIAFDTRTYYFTQDFSDNQIYNQGYQNGLADNQQNVYDSGYLAGKITGEAIGYDKGILEANDYSFASLFGAVIDAPIKAFSGLFSFEILGINLLDFFLGLLTFGLIIFVIKLLLGGR